MYSPGRAVREEGRSMEPLDLTGGEGRGQGHSRTYQFLPVPVYAGGQVLTATDRAPCPLTPSPCAPRLSLHN